MRQISREAARRFINKQPFKRSNTEVIVDSSGYAVLWLFGNPIATNEYNNDIYICHQGFITATTQDRINAVLREVKSNLQMARRYGTAYLRDPRTGVNILFPTGWYNIKNVQKKPNIED